tara:strand:- start:1923 stop:2714 length:792 start_codon:yes stop_codon:yes gene_type:complete
LKKIIYNVWSDLKVPHTSVPDHKKDSFAKYKNQLIDIQKDYAHACGADYEIFNPPVHDYVNVQFHKLFKFEQLTKYYDKVVYLDVDVIPITKKNIFDQFNFNNICVYDYHIDINDSSYRRNIIYRLKNKKPISPMNRHSKVCAKRAMLLLHDINGNDNICNTGVFAGNKLAAEKLAFSDNIALLDKTLEEAKEDTVYPEEYSKQWIRNNEVYVSFLLEKFNIKFNNIGIQWNYILDDKHREYTSGAHLIHQVNKDFNETLKHI